VKINDRQPTHTHTHAETLTFSSAKKHNSLAFSLYSSWGDETKNKRKKNFPFSLVNSSSRSSSSRAVFNKILFHSTDSAHNNNPHEKVGDRGGCLIGLPLGLSLSFFLSFFFFPSIPCYSFYIISISLYNAIRFLLFNISWFDIGRTRVFTLETRWSKPLDCWFFSCDIRSN
jgi:hypothetical protein